MGIHGDKSQQERDWVLNGKYLSNFGKIYLLFDTWRNWWELLALQSSNMEKHQSWLLQMLHPEV